MAHEESSVMEGVTRRSVLIALGLTLLWCLGCCYMAVCYMVKTQLLLMVLGFAAILTVLLVRFPVLFMISLGVFWGGTCVGMRFFSGIGPDEYAWLYAGMLRGLPILLLLFGLAIYLWKRPLKHGELAVIFACVVIAIPWCICIKAVIESSTANLFEHQQRSEPQLYQWSKAMPWWGPTVPTETTEPAPQALEAVRGFSHGNGGDVPWSLWWRPILYWTAMCVCYQAMLMGLLLMFRKAWVERQRLPFVWAQPAVTLIRSDWRGPTARRMWLWFGVGLLICLPGTMGISTTGEMMSPVGCPPWVSEQGIRGGVDLTDLNLLPGTPMRLFWGPLVLAFLLLFPVDILMTVAVTFILLNIVIPGLMRSFGMSTGSQYLGQFVKSGLRFGGAVGILFWSIWFNRKEIADFIRSWWTKSAPVLPQDDELSRRTVSFVAIGGLIGFVALGCYATNLVQMLFLTFFLLVYAFAQARQRAEGFLCSYDNNIASHQMVSIQRDFLHDHFTLSPTTTSADSWATHWFQWGFVGQLKTYGPQNMLLEAFKVGHEMKVHARSMAKAIAVSMLLVAVVTPVLYLQLMYTYGFDNSYDGPLSTWGSFTQWSERGASYGLHSTSKWFATTAEDFYNKYRKIFHVFYGVGIIGILYYLRREYPRFPFSPIGVVIAAEQFSMSTIPFSPSYIWFSFLVIWLIKTLIFRWVGVRSFHEKVQPAVVMVLCGLIFGMAMYVLRYVSLGYGCLK